ncbi:putative virulence effector protein [Trabulsiella guamensis ATCC 49490]|uniref:Putative virulence effector protein n=1 Tax=Trabulsiella guamensis ATCC 49490 TaxID=1005994 RepID=A0A085AK26_9ENTR|nr:SrfA family protein [Trabulsiella guamensis]KFC10571.1 putative virulence effector protein [Trabulsiella guamensis ATCC 49490]
MTKTLLRSGDLDDFQAVGGGGQAVFDSALQIRETLRLRKQLALVDCLAIPQINDDNDRVAWYAPIEGKAITWKAADNETRERALRFLHSTFDSALVLSRKSLQSDKTAQQLFGALLEKALQFPGENHVYLVDGKPVITFWGFINLNENTRDDALACLTLPEPEPVIEQLPEPPAETLPEPVMFSDGDKPLFTPAPSLPEPPFTPVEITEPEVTVAVPLIPETPPQPENTMPAPRRRRVPLWSLPVAAVVVAAVGAPMLWKQDAPTAVPAPVVAQTPAPVVLPAPADLPKLTAGLPLHQADVVKAKEEAVEQKATPANEPVVIAAIPKDALIMEAGQLKAGTTRFLNGNWRVLGDIKDPSGKAPSLRYQIQNNKGTARVVHGKNIVCRAEIFSGLHQSGELLIKSRGAARCADGSRYPMPEITCKAGTSDVAQCTGRYDAKTIVPLTFKKTGA